MDWTYIVHFDHSELFKVTFTHFNSQTHWGLSALPRITSACGRRKLGSRRLFYPQSHSHKWQFSQPCCIVREAVFKLFSLQHQADDFESLCRLVAETESHFEGCLVEEIRKYINLFDTSMGEPKNFLNNKKYMGGNRSWERVKVCVKVCGIVGKKGICHKKCRSSKLDYEISTIRGHGLSRRQV